jgi:hypothetical protein
MIISAMTPEELAAFVCSHLESHGITVVLSGGSCVSIYTENRYQSYDFDFVPRDLFLKRKDLVNALAEIGFTEKNRYFQHPDSEYLLEFPPGPLTVGDEPVKEVVSKYFATGTLRLISATDSVKDRLAGYYHWNDRQCLEQAIMITHTCEVDIEEIKRWSESEGKLDTFNEIINRLS